MPKGRLLNVLMPRGRTDIVVQYGVLRVQYDAIDGSPHRRFYIGAGHLLFCLAVLCGCLLSGWKNGAPSPWQDMQTYPVDSFGFLLPVCLIVFILVLCVRHLTKIIPAVYPGGQKLECDGETLTVSRIRWLDWHNKEWISETYQLKEVSRIRYGTIVIGKGNSIYGFRFQAAGRTYRLFPALTSRQVGKILAGFEALGADTDRLRKARERELRKRKVRA